MHNQRIGDAHGEPPDAASDPGAARMRRIQQALEASDQEPGFERPSPEALEFAGQAYNGSLTAGLPTPGVFADPEGGVRLEWLRERRHTVIAIDNAGSALVHSYDANTAAEEHEFVQGSAAAVAFAAAFVAPAL